MIYLDSNVFIFALLYDDEVIHEAKISRVILNHIIGQKILAFTSTLTWDEVVYVVMKKAGQTASVLTGEKLLMFPNLKMIPADQEILKIAQDLIGRYSIRPRDAIHLASAMKAGCETILSEDSDFDKINEVKRVSLRDYVFEQ